MYAYPSFYVWTSPFKYATGVEDFCFGLGYQNFLQKASKTSLHVFLLPYYEVDSFFWGGGKNYNQPFIQSQNRTIITTIKVPNSLVGSQPWANTYVFHGFSLLCSTSFGLFIITLWILISRSGGFGYYRCLQIMLSLFNK